MTMLDYNYIASLVKSVQEEDSNAFAELYLATYQKQYRFALNYLGDEYLAQDAIQETYILALKNIFTIKDPKLFVSWLNQINFRVCLRMHQKQLRLSSEIEDLSQSKDSDSLNPENHIVQVDENEYILRQIMNLPFSESQSILLRYYNNMKIDEIAELLDCSRSSVKRYIKSGQERLKQLINH